MSRYKFEVKHVGQKAFDIFDELESVKISPNIRRDLRDNLDNEHFRLFIERTEDGFYLSKFFLLSEKMGFIKP